MSAKINTSNLEIQINGEFSGGLLEKGQVTKESEFFEIGDNAGGHTTTRIRFKDGTGATNASRPNYGSRQTFTPPSDRDWMYKWETIEEWQVIARFLEIVGSNPEFLIIDAKTLMITDGNGTWLKAPLATFPVTTKWGYEGTAATALKKGRKLTIKQGEHWKRVVSK